MADEQHREAEAHPQVGQQRQHLRLHRDVQRRHRLIRHQEFRIHSQRPGDPDPLALAAGEFVREAVGVGRRQPDLIQQRGNAPR